ncbi:hypothetical protein BLA28_09630 [Eisenbergiella tayi]|nr:hypothetical protein BLA28_09630 [Eisenbergiella tayi]
MLYLPFRSPADKRTDTGLFYFLFFHIPLGKAMTYPYEKIDLLSYCDGMIINQFFLLPGELL